MLSGALIADRRQNMASVEASPTRRYFAEGRSCAECVLLAADLPSGPERDALVAAARGLGAGRAVTCAAMLAGLMALGVWGPAAKPRSRPMNDLLDSYLPPGSPGASPAQNMAAPEQFKARFESAARVYNRGITCAGLSHMDWGRRDPAGAPAGYPPHICVKLADVAVEELNRLIADKE
jgi:hypothetical protein